MPALPARSPLFPPPTRFSSWPRLRRAALSQQLDSCVQSETTYNSRRFKGVNFGVKCCSAPALSSSFLRGTRGTHRPRTGAQASPGFSRWVPELCWAPARTARLPGIGDLRGTVEGARRRGGWHRPGTQRWARGRVRTPARPLQLLREQPAAQPPAAMARW